MADPLFFLAAFPHEIKRCLLDGGSHINVFLGGSSTHGLYAETGGAGRVTIDLDGDTGSSTTIRGDTRIEAIAGTGGILLNLDATVTDSGAGALIVTDSPGLTEINLLGGRLGAAGHVPNPTGEQVALRSSGDQIVVDQSAGFGLFGILDFTGITGSSEVRIGDEWRTTGTPDTGQTTFGPGDDLIHVLPGGLMVTSAIRDLDSDALDPETEIDFGDGNSAIVNAGSLYVGQKVSAEELNSIESHTIFANLDSFENSGLIVMGETDGQSDNNGDDVLTMLGTAYTGSGDARIAMDVDLNALGQTNCEDRQADGNLVAADCIDIRNGTVAGRTGLVLAERFPGDRGAYNPDGNVLIDVSGGSGAADAFYVHPDSENYSPAFGGVIDKGFFFYPVAFDAETQQYKMFGVLGGPALQMPLLAHAAQSLWRTSAVSRFDRQRNLGEGLSHNADLNKGVWFRLSNQSGERDVMQSVVAGTDTFEFDNSYEQDSTALTLGVDFIQNGSWVVGGQVGYVTSSLDYDDSPNDVNFEGMSVGLYGSLLVGDFFVDALVNGNWLEQDNDVPSLDLFPEGTILSSDVKTYGAQVEAGWSGLSFGRLGIEPLANLSYVLADFDKVEVPADDPIRLGANVEYDDPVSFRGGLGVRLSVKDVVPGFVPVDVSLTTRAVNEFDGESKVVIENLGPNAAVANEFDGTFAEVSGSVTVSNTAKTVAGYLNVDGTFESDYESLGVEAGFRYQW